MSKLGECERFLRKDGRNNPLWNHQWFVVLGWEEQRFSPRPTANLLRACASLPPVVQPAAIGYEIPPLSDKSLSLLLRCWLLSLVRLLSYSALGYAII